MALAQTVNSKCPALNIEHEQPSERTESVSLDQKDDPSSQYALINAMNAPPGGTSFSHLQKYGTIINIQDKGDVSSGPESKPNQVVKPPGLFAEYFNPDYKVPPYTIHCCFRHHLDLNCRLCVEGGYVYDQAPQQTRTQRISVLDDKRDYQLWLSSMVIHPYIRVLNPIFGRKPSNLKNNSRLNEYQKPINLACYWPYEIKIIAALFSKYLAVLKECNNPREKVMHHRLLMYYQIVRQRLDEISDSTSEEWKKDCILCIFALSGACEYTTCKYCNMMEKWAYDRKIKLPSRLVPCCVMTEKEKYIMSQINASRKGNGLNEPSCTHGINCQHPGSVCIFNHAMGWRPNGIEDSNPLPSCLELTPEEIPTHPTLSMEEVRLILNDIGSDIIRPVFTYPVSESDHDKDENKQAESNHDIFSESDHDVEFELELGSELDKQVQNDSEPKSGSGTDSKKIPNCKYKSSCKRPNCKFTHPNRHRIMKSPTDVTDKSNHDSAGSMIRCRYGLSCTRPDCKFVHPEKHNSQKYMDGKSNKLNKSKEGLRGKKTCKFGKDCNRENCIFVHPVKLSESSTPHEHKSETLTVKKVVSYQDTLSRVSPVTTQSEKVLTKVSHQHIPWSEYHHSLNTLEQDVHYTCHEKEPHMTK